MKPFVIIRRQTTLESRTLVLGMPSALKRPLTTYPKDKNRVLMNYEAMCIPRTGRCQAVQGVNKQRKCQKD